MPVTKPLLWSELLVAKLWLLKSGKPHTLSRDNLTRETRTTDHFHKSCTRMQTNQSNNMRLCINCTALSKI
jgi:hypothetical protein